MGLGDRLAAGGWRLAPRIRKFRIPHSAFRIFPLLAALIFGLQQARTAEEAPSPEFTRALRLFLDADPQRRAEGEKQIQALGKRAAPQLKAWLARSQGDLERARALLVRLGGEPVEASEALVAARPFLAGAVASAWSKFHSGEYREAQKTAEAVIRLDPETPDLWQMRRLIRRCEERLISTEVIEPTVEFRELVYGLDESPRVLFRVVNRSRLPIRLWAERGILGSLQLVFERRYMDGSERTDQRTQLIRTNGGEEDISLPAGASYEREFTIWIEEPKPAQGMALRLKASGKFQPSRWQVDSKLATPAISLPAAECWLVAPGQKNLAGAPLKKLETALFFHDLQAFFTGGQLSVWAAEDDPLLNEKLLRVLVESLAELDEVGTGVADSLLVRASGRKHDVRATTPTDVRQDWQHWWQARKRGEAEAGEAPSPLPPFERR
jgi:hypothetical protein